MPSSTPKSTLFPYTTLFRSRYLPASIPVLLPRPASRSSATRKCLMACASTRSEEHTSELQSLRHLVCRLQHRNRPSFPTRRSSDLDICPHRSPSFFQDPLRGHQPPGNV